MSHYSVLVFTEKGQDYTDLLEPYNENITVEPYVLYTKESLIEKKKKDIEEYRTKGCYAEYLKDKEKYRLENSRNSGHLEYVEKVFPKILNMTDEELYDYYVKEYDNVDANGSVISTYNPKSKWDWYVLGGRWGYGLKLKSNLEYTEDEDEYGYLVVKEKSLSEALKKDNTEVYTCNEGYAKHLDFSPEEEDYKDAIEFWENYVEGKNPEKEFSMYKPEYYKNRYGSKEDYAKETAAFSTYAIVTPDGEWHEPGQMGWFGVSCASDEDEEKWYSEYNKFLEEAVKNDWYCYLVDCHI